MDFSRSTSQSKLRKIQHQLSKSAMTHRQLSKVIFCSESGLLLYLKTLKANGLIHISGYLDEPFKKKKSRLPLWIWGDGIDAVKPRPATPLDHYHKKKALLGGN